MDQVILVDQNDRARGTNDKMDAHRCGELHRAFSVFVFDSRGRLLVQQRAETKYHTGGMWTNTCDGHPRPGETVKEAAHRRLGEEMGFDCALGHAFAFTYRAELGNGLVENEYDHVLIGTYDGDPTPAEEEIAAYKWIDVERLVEDVRRDPDRYAPWFTLALDRLRHGRVPLDGCGE
jgi:isopentenyl-diphosphate delta-isomerase